jgi:MSHA pilin protein MshA
VKNRQEKGFTLIELIIVIVILGILAVTAAPRFIDLGTDAKLAKLESIKGVIVSTTKLVNYKAVIENKTDCSTDPTIAIGTDNITLRCGYPCPHYSGIGLAVDTGDGATWSSGNCSGQLGWIELTLDNATDSSNCKIRYNASRGGSFPQITLTNTGC